MILKIKFELSVKLKRVEESQVHQLVNQLNNRFICALVYSEHRVL